MKTRFLLCMMALWAICAAAQPQMPPKELTVKVTNGHFFQMPNPHHIMIEPSVTNTDRKKFKRVAKALADETKYQVDVTLDFDTEIQEIIDITFVNKDSAIYAHNQIYDLSKGSNLLQIQTGTYDIIAEFWQYVNSTDEDTPLFKRFVILEQVTIDQDMQISISASDAKNHIHCQTLTIDGDSVQTSRWFVDDNWNFNEVETGNIEDLTYQNYIFCPDLFSTNWSGNFGAVFEGAMQANGGEQLADFYVNDVSERYSFYSYRTFFKENEIYTTAYEIQGASNDTTVYNDPSKYVLFEEPFANNQHPDAERHRSYMSTIDHPNFVSWHTIESNSMTPLLPDQPIKTYIGTSAEDSEAGFIPVIGVGTSVQSAYEIFKPIESVYLTKKGDNIAVATGNMLFNETTNLFHYEYSPEDGDLGDVTICHLSPNPDFSYRADKKVGNFGSNCPLLVSNMYQFYQELAVNDIITDQYYEWHFLFDYIGQFGEFLNNGEALVNLKLNGEDLLEYQGSFVAQGAAPLEGVVDATIVNEGLLVDDLEASNQAQLHYTAGADDETPPTATMLQFRAGNGDVTNRFATADDGIMQLTAGDFNFFITPMTFWAPIRQPVESVGVSYSPYGEHNWNELPVEEVPENYWPVMGWFYSGSLAGVTGEALNGWFDLKIRLTDAAGNWQEQVLSPAFRIDDLAYSSVATVGSSNAHEVARYNLAGQRVDTNTPGVAIVKMSDGTARKVIVP